MCQELLDAEPESKWAMLTRARVLRAMARWNGGEGEDEAVMLYSKLQEVDPARAGYYADEIAGKSGVMLDTARLQA